MNEADLDKMREALDALWRNNPGSYAYRTLREEYHIALFKAGRILEHQIETADKFVLNPEINKRIEQYYERYRHRG